MPEENAEIVRRALAAFAARDVEAWVELFDADVELLLPRNVLEGGSYKGRNGVFQSHQEALEAAGLGEFGRSLTDESQASGARPRSPSARRRSK